MKSETEREREREKIGIVGTKLHEEIDPMRFHFDRADAEFCSSILRFSIHLLLSPRISANLSILFESERGVITLSKRDGKILFPRGMERFWKSSRYIYYIIDRRMYIYLLDVILCGKIVKKYYQGL